MNLSTARAGLRAREIGLRKVVGGYRKQLISQFLSESVCISLIALIFSIIILEMAMPVFRNLTAKNLDIHYFSNIFVVPGMICFTGLIGVLAGIYPAFILSSFQPIKVLRGTFAGCSKGPLLRRIMVTLQFSISTILIIGTGVVYKQLDFIHNRDLGFDREQVLAVPISNKYQTNYEALKNELREVLNVVNITTSSYFKFTSR